MAKYQMGEQGQVFKNTKMPNDTPVVVVPEADWRALLKHLECKVPWDGREIDAIIQRTEANNG